MIKFKKGLTSTDKSEHTIRIYLNAVKSFYQANDIRPPEITMSKGADLILMLKYEFLNVKSF
jgi:hypothetical protein